MCLHVFPLLCMDMSRVGNIPCGMWQCHTGVALPQRVGFTRRACPLSRGSRAETKRVCLFLHTPTKGMRFRHIPQTSTVASSPLRLQVFEV